MADYRICEIDVALLRMLDEMDDARRHYDFSIERDDKDQADRRLKQIKNLAQSLEALRVASKRAELPRSLQM